MSDILTELRFRELQLLKQEKRAHEFMLRILSSSNFGQNAVPLKMSPVFPEQSR